MWKRPVVGLMLLGLAEAVIRPGPFFGYRDRADAEAGRRPDDGNLQTFPTTPAASVLAETVEVIGLPLIFSSLSRSNTGCVRVSVAPS